MLVHNTIKNTLRLSNPSSHGPLDASARSHKGILGVYEATFCCVQYFHNKSCQLLYSSSKLEL